jgi:hypothetical protein
MRSKRIKKWGKLSEDKRKDLTIILKLYIFRVRVKGTFGGYEV